MNLSMTSLTHFTELFFMTVKALEELRRQVKSILISLRQGQLLRLGVRIE